MLNSEKKICALRDKKNKYSNSCVVRKFFSERNKKTIASPPQAQWSVPYNCYKTRTDKLANMISFVTATKLEQTKYLT